MEKPTSIEVTPAAERYSNMKQVCEHYGIAVSTLYRFMEEGTFPKPTRIGSAVRWKISEIDAHIAASKAP